jgi:uncharacterized protein
MLQPGEMKLDLPILVANEVISSTSLVWQILVASYNGDLDEVKCLSKVCPELLHAQYNYTPPIHFAVREGHTELVKYLLANGAHNPAYKIYPFQESLQTIAADRGFEEIVSLLDEYATDSSRHKYTKDNGRIFYSRSELEEEFEKAVDNEDLGKTEEILKLHPEFAKDQTYFWGEGILTFAAKENNRHMVDLLMNYGARVPDILKWTQFYYFEHNEGAEYMMEKGMNPNTMSWHHVSILHDMSQKGNISKVKLLIQYGADLNAIDEEYQSTPLGMAARWGHLEMVQLLLEKGGDPTIAGANWATPIEWARTKGYERIEKLLREKISKT